MDLQTLYIEHAVFLGFYTVLTLANVRMHGGSRGVRWFTLYSIFVFIGAVLVALSGVIPDAFSVVAGEGFVSIGYVLLYRSLAAFFTLRTVRWTPHVACVLVVLLGALRYGLLAPDERKEMIVISLVLTAQLILVASVVMRNARDDVRVSSVWMALVLSLLALSKFLVFLGVVARGPVASYFFSGRTLIEWNVLVTSVLQGAVTVAFVWMTAAALRHDLYLEASTDWSTGLMNRRAITAAADKEIASGRQEVEQMTAILLDLDKFKGLNDGLGHQGGDAAIIAVARRLEQGIRKGDLVARLGGDEFVVLLPKTSMATALEVAENFRASFAGAPVVYGGGEMSMTGSFGVAQVHGSNQGWKQLITACDTALYKSKAAGGNCVSTL